MVHSFRFRKACSGVAALLVVYGSLTILGAVQSGKDAEGPLKLKADLILVEAEVVSGTTGRVIYGLSKEDFTVEEDGVRQVIEHFSQDNQPLSILLLLDVSGSVEKFLIDIKENGLKALRHLNTDDEVAVMGFGRWTTVIQEFTKNREMVLQKIGLVESMGPWIRERTYSDEAAFQAANFVQKASNPASRRSIVVITDNLNNQPKGEGHSESEALTLLNRHSGVVSCLVVGNYSALSVDYRTRGMEVQGAFNRYVRETGGILMMAANEQVSSALAELLERLRTRYTLGYFSKNGKADGKFRQVKVRLSSDIEKREGRIAVTARKGYFAPKL
jgi:VWFA-related protein